MPPKPDNYLVWSILVTVLCCLPFGIVAIIKSTSVDSAYNAGNLPAAQAAAADAKKWCIIGAASGAIVCVLYVLLIFVGALAS